MPVSSPRPAVLLAAFALVLGGLAVAVGGEGGPEVPRDDEAVYLLMTASLVEDGDLLFDHRDLFRGYRAWPSGPAGLALRSPDDGASFHYARPALYPLLASPVYAAAGRRGVLAAQALVFAALLAAAVRLWSGPAEGGAGARLPLLAAVFFLASGALGHVFRVGPGVLRLAAVFFALALAEWAWWRARAGETPGAEAGRLPLAASALLSLSAAGGLLALAARHASLDGLLVVPLVLGAWLMVGRPGARPAPAKAAAAAAVLVGFGAVFAAVLLAEKAVSPPGGSLWGLPGTGAMESRVFTDTFPVEGPPETWSRAPREAALVGSVRGGAAGWGASLGRRGMELLFGRSGGLLAFYPFALFALAAALAYAVPGRRSDGGQRWRLLLLAGGLLPALAVLWLLPPSPGWGGSGEALAGGLGPESMVGLYAAFFFLLPRNRPRPALFLLPLAAAALWTLPALVSSFPGSAPGAAGAERAGSGGAPSVAFRYLPLELSRLSGFRHSFAGAAGGQEGADEEGAPSSASALAGGGAALSRSVLPGYRARSWGGEIIWLLPEATAYLGERHPRGVWLRGATRSRLIAVAPRDLTVLHLTLRSASAENTVTLTTPVEEVTVRFDSPGKREGTPVAVRVTPAARNLGAFFPVESVYLLDVETSDGLVPKRRDPSSSDPRLLGVFLDLAGDRFP